MLNKDVLGLYVFYKEEDKFIDWSGLRAHLKADINYMTQYNWCLSSVAYEFNDFNEMCYNVSNSNLIQQYVGETIFYMAY